MGELRYQGHNQLTACRLRDSRKITYRQSQGKVTKIIRKEDVGMLLPITMMVFPR
jgi:hypothetical protein